jgi:multidrug efflux pump subunit AcrB
VIRHGFIARRHLLIAAAGLVGCGFGYQTVGTAYLPALDEGGFVPDFITPAPSTLADTQALLGKIQGVLKTYCWSESPRRRCCC